MNGYYGALLWASVALSQDYVNYAKLLLATEQQASKVYWHLYPQQDQNARDNPYPESSMRSLVSMGNVMDFQSGAWLFWGSQKVEIAAIQILPLTPVNEVSPHDWRLEVIFISLSNLTNRCSMTPSGYKMYGHTPCQSLLILLLAMNGMRKLVLAS